MQHKSPLKACLPQRAIEFACAVVVIAFGPTLVEGQRANFSAFSRESPEKIVGSTVCGECHIEEFEVWKDTPHATQFRGLHRTEPARAVADKMDVRLMKRDSVCLSCHYTPTERGGQIRALSGVSCESCHGAARDWIDIHNDYGDGFDRDTEPAEHRDDRVSRSRAAGMRRPTDLFETVSSCFGCHTVPSEQLVNQGGHSTGSVGFELVEWSQGQIRHNFLESSLSGDGSGNRERSLAEKRRMYVAGRALDVEFTLRGLAEAEVEGTYAKAMGRRVRVTLLELRKILQRVPVPELEAIQALVADVKAVPNNREALLQAADRVAVSTRQFLDSYSSDQLADIDPLILGTATTEPDPEPTETEDTVTAEAPLSGSSVEPKATGEVATSETVTTSSGPAAATRDPGQPAVGRFKRRVRPRPDHSTLGPGACGGCHETANQWLATDPHYRSADPFLQANPANVKIARLFGLKTAQMGLGNQICMDCHGTVITGNEDFDVIDGVSCESCHGAAKDFLEPHKEGEKSLGTSRPGYVDALGLGMVKLQDLNVRATQCTGCHYITEPRLISSGHSSGRDFDYADAMTKIRHWERQPASGAEINRSFSAALAKRGGVPDVVLARLPEAVPRTGASVAARQDGSERSPRLESSTGAAWNAPRPRPRSLTPLSASTSTQGRPFPAAAIGQLELPPFPEVSENTTIEDLLLILKGRLELLHSALESKKGARP